MARYALVVGIAKYDRLPSLAKPHTDAEAIAQLLSQYGDFQEIRRLPASWNTEKNCYEVAYKPLSGKELGQTLRQFLLEQADKSEAIIYFSGHGVSVEDNLGRRKGYLVTSDCTLETLDTRGISLESLNQLIEESNLSSLVVLLDCCHAGYALERNLVKQTFTAFSAQKDYYLIAACRGFEKAYEGDSTTEYSLFTETLLRGLSTENAGNDGQVSGDRLFDYVSRTLRNSGQEPIRMGWGRSIPLVTNLPQPATSAATPADFNRENPYLGLRAFESDQEEYFCGRVQSVRALLARLTNNRFLAVIGPSGCGKSSLVRAGLLPQLQRDLLPGSSKWEPEVFTPGNHPLEKLMEALQRHQQQGQPFVLFIDQFEELFTLCEDKAERWNFIRLMAEEATSSERMTRVIVAIRAAFLEQCAPYPEAADLINQARPTTYIVPPLTFSELEAAIEQPASLHGVTFERGLVSQIANDVVERPGALPLLQYALTELWRVCIQEPPSPQPFLTWQGYQAIGGVKGALEQRANLLYQSFSPKDQAFIRCLFLELVQLNEGGEVSRRRATWSDLEALADSPEQLDRVTRLLSGQQQRLIITSDKTVEVAHEALFSEWKLLHDWIEENREDIQINRRLEAACREWQDTYQQSDDALLTGAPLAAIEAWAQKNQPKLPPQEAEFLQKSIEKRDRETQDKINQAKNKTRVAITLGLLSTLTLSLSLTTNKFAEERQQSEAITVGALISTSQQLFEANKQLEALIVSVDALKRLKKTNIKNPTGIATLQSVIYGIRESNRLQAHQGGVNGVSFSPNGQMIASAGADQTVILWNMKGNIKNPPLKGHKNQVWSVRFSPDSTTLASASTDKTIRLWSTGGKFLRSLVGHESSVYDVSFSADSKTIASSSADGTIKLWDVKKGILLRTLRDKEFPTNEQYVIYSLDFNPKNQTVLASTGGSIKSKGNYVNIWNLKSNKNDEPIHIGEHQYPVSSVRFSSDGNILASGAHDGIIKLWKTSNNRQVGEIKAHNNEVFYLEFSHNNQLIGSAGQDGTVRVWNVQQALDLWNQNRTSLKEPLLTLKGHTGPVGRLSFNRKFLQYLASASDDGTIRIWMINQENLIQENLQSLSNQDTYNSLITYSCDFLKDYLQVSANSKSEYSNTCKN